MDENYISISLPSKCLSYVDIKAENVAIRTLKGRDEKIVAEMSSDNFDKKFSSLVKMVTKGIPDPDKLTLGDRIFIAIWLVINSFDKNYTVEHECETCWVKSEYVIDLSSLNKVELPDKYSEPYEVKLPLSGETVKLRLLTVADIIKIKELEKLNQNTWLYRYALTMVNDKNLVENEEYLGKLASKDLTYIRGFQDKFNHGIEFKANYTCLRCGGVGIMPIPFRIDMLLPYGEKLKRDIGGAI